MCGCANIPVDKTFRIYYDQVSKRDSLASMLLKIVKYMEMEELV